MIQQDISIQQMELYIQNFYEKYKYSYIKFESDEDIINIYRLLTTQIVTKTNRPHANHYYGVYYKIRKKNKLMKKYYLLAIKANYQISMINLARYYHSIDYYDLMIKYCNMAIELNNSIAMHYLANYYESIGNYIEAIKLYKMAIKLDNVNAMEDLGNYYNSIGKDKSMIKYYKMAIELNNCMAMNNLAHYYESIDDYNQMIYYYKMAIRLNNCNAMIHLANYYHSIGDYEKKIKYYIMAANLNNITALTYISYHYKSKKNYPDMKLYMLKILNLGSDIEIFKVLLKHCVKHRDYDLLIVLYNNYPQLCKCSEFSSCIKKIIKNDQYDKNNYQLSNIIISSKYSNSFIIKNLKHDLYKKLQNRSVSHC